MSKEQENKEVPQVQDSSQEDVLTIPDMVRNKEAYLRYIELKGNPVLLKENRMLDTSDPELIVDPLLLPHILQERIGHLPLEEQEKIKRRSKGLKVIQQKILNEHMKAFGTKRKNASNSIQRALVDERSAELIAYFGKFFTVQEVHKIVTQEWGYSVQLNGINTFRKRNIDKITAAQENHKRDYGELRLSHKKSRLEELQELYADRKQKYQISSTKDDYKLLLQTLQHIQKECEVDTLRLEGQINHSVEVTLNYHIEQEVMKNMTLNDIIIGRVAARNGVNSTFLVERLHHSIYAKFSGFAKPEDDENLMNQEIQYPSKMVYNWDSIRKIEEAKVVEDKELMAHKEMSKEKETQAEEVKDVLKQRMQELRDLRNSSQARVQDNQDKKSEK